MNIFNAIENGFFMIYKSDNQFCLVDFTTAHLQKVSISFLQNFFDKFIFVCNNSDSCDCVTSQMRMY